MVQKPTQGEDEAFPGQELKFIFVRHQLPGFIIRSEIVGETIIKFSPIYFQTMSYIQKSLQMTDVTEKSNIMQTLLELQGTFAATVNAGPLKAA